MMFTEKAMKAAEEKFSRLLEKAGEKKREEILSRLAQAEKTESADVIAAIKWIYANSPLSDLANYDFEIFQSCAEHGVFLRENSPFAKDLPEDIFLNYVLHVRVNEEELCDCRKFFYGLLADRVNSLSMHDAIIEANYWNAENRQPYHLRTGSVLFCIRPLRRGICLRRKRIPCHRYSCQTDLHTALGPL